MLQQFFLFLWKRRRILLLNAVFVCVVAWAYAWFVVKKEYQAQITFLPPTGESSSAFELMGIPLPSMSGSSILTEQIETIFDSKAIKRRIVEKFDLYTVFKLSKKADRFESAVRKLRTYVILRASQKGSMGFEKIISYSITCYHPSPDSAKRMCEYAYALLDSTVKDISQGRARRNRVFVEEQLRLHKVELDSLQKSFEEFQVANKAFVVPEQLRLSLKTYAELKSAAILNELKMKSLQREFKGDLPELDELQKTNSLYNQKLSQIESSANPDVMPSLGLSAKLLPRYTNLMREIEVQNQVILLLEKEVEQARLQESKDVSSLVVVDPAYVPEYKTRPKRLALLLLIVLIEHLFLFVLFAYQFYFASILMKHEKVQSLIQAMKSSR
jgi:uncharacterized protein involved in exopolysaccharide biosynthesis